MLDAIFHACVNNFDFVVIGCLLITMLFGMVLGILVGVYIHGLKISGGSK